MVFGHVSQLVGHVERHSYGSSFSLRHTGRDVPPEFMHVYQRGRPEAGISAG
jgi:hypothetical protein